MQLPKLSSYSLPPLTKQTTSATPKVSRNPAPVAPKQGTPFASPEDDDMTAGIGDDVAVEIGDEDDGGDLELMDDVPIIEGDRGATDDNERRLVLYVDENLAHYLVKYVSLLKKSQQPAGMVVFAPFDGR